MIRPLILSALGLLVALSSGCAEATIASAGALAGLAASTVSTGADVYRMGKLNAVDMVEFEEQVELARDSAADLKLTIEKQEYYEPGRWRCTILDDRESRFRVYIDRRTGNLCRTKIDVGVAGSEPTARLFIARMRAATRPGTRERLGVDE